MFLQILISGLVIGSTYGLIALGYSLIYKASGLMSFAQGDMLTFGAFLGYTLYSTFGIPFPITCIVVVVFMFFLGILVEKGIIRRLVQKHVLPIYTVLATIALQFIIQNGSQIVFGSETKYFPPILSTRSVDLFERSIQSEAVLCILASVLCMVILNMFITRTPLGTSMRAAAMDPIAAQACGIDVSLTTGLAWGLAAGMAAFAGMLLGPVYGVYTTLGAVIGRKGFTSAVIGGFGNMIGAIVGGLILGVVETFISAYASSAYKDIIAYALLLILLFVKPTGLFNERAITD